METLKRIREYELAQVLPQFPPGARILEIGAGAGWQARTLSEKGFTVEAVDTPDGGYEQERIWPVTIYDGHVLPFPDEAFDVVFSSNVLEHIPHLEQFQAEIKRVLKPDGKAVHVVPSAGWRIWTSATYFPRLFQDALKQPGVMGKFRHLRANRIPPRHGEHGSSSSEIFFFRKAAWLELFATTGWKVEEAYPNRLFYTGHLLFDAVIPFRLRRLISHVLGSSCNIICLRKPE